MTTYIVDCKQCGRAFEPDHRTIIAGSWRLCPTCQPQPSGESHCERCGRALRTTGRRLCLTCLGVPAL
jgi:hypothetical protein